ncbi:ABC transporter permease [Desulfofundulus thermosubterraneus]|uniref:Transport permease protein n=1 Tax=Desulfofundulus thermosubterraneus DSM 16057 TaxID=1121432 RepID=A0A1M6HMG1_9FIRM|nr:ABC transporter permease [Desulfofundulus thermosubterraneus]SHJ23365.1 lipooligosaccharide transport system permease protein [Desulfofundulus thermosubterraneus DSM 16057]
MKSLDVSPLVWQVLRRHLIVFSRNWKTNLSFNFFEPLLYIAALGLGLGAYVQPMEGLPYLNYLAPGLVASSAMFATSYECTYGTFVRMEYQKTFYAMVATPVSIDDVIVAEILYGTFKSVLYGSVILVVILALGLVASPWALLVPPVLAVGGFLFAVLSMIWTGLVPNIENFNYFFSLIMTPLFLFSGVFFPLSGLPRIIQTLAWASPLCHVVNLVRGLVLGRVHAALIWDFMWLVTLTAVLFPLPLYLMRRLVIK